VSIAFELPPAYSKAGGRGTTTHRGAISIAGFETSNGASRGWFPPDDFVNEDDVVSLFSQPRAIKESTAREQHGAAVVGGCPPTYTHFDEQARVFSLCNGSVMNTFSDDGIERPRYQLRHEYSGSGRLWKLQIRGLLPSENRRLSMSNASANFDVKTTLYGVQKLAALYALRNRLDVQLRGSRAGTLQGQGHIEACEKTRDG
jgi:hypothetical protein